MVWVCLNNVVDESVCVSLVQLYVGLSYYCVKISGDCEGQSTTEIEEGECVFLSEGGKDCESDAAQPKSAR